MAEERKKCVCGCDGNGTCMCGWHHGHMLFRLLIGIIILILVFWFGVKLGELREIVRGGYGGGQYYPMMRYRTMPSMTTMPSPTATPSTTATP